MPNVNKDLIQALDLYRDAITSRVYWQDHGTHKDGRLDAAQSWERNCRLAVFRTAVQHSTPHDGMLNDTRTMYSTGSGSRHSDKSPSMYPKVLSLGNWASHVRLSTPGSKRL